MNAIRPQPGPQTQFLTTPASIAIYGGAAGGGKSWALVADDLYHKDNPRYASVTFRRTYPQITNPGGLWDEASQVYPSAGGKPNLSGLTWTFPSGARVKFAHMQYESDKLQWQGSQIPVIKFDELTHFSETMFFYMLSRNRSTSGVPSYIRATCNADADSWVATLIDWWIDQETGLPDKEKAGAIRWFVRVDGEMVWADDPADLPWIEVEIDGEMVAQPPKSLTFIPAKVTDNKILLAKDPGYLTSLLSLDPLERGRLLEGNWKIKPAAGLFFKRHWFEIVDAVPADAKACRSWDFAATKPKPGKDPDWTAGGKLAHAHNGLWYIEDMRRLRDTPLMVEQAITQTAELDGRYLPIYLEQEPGSAGVNVMDHYARVVLPGYPVYPVKNTDPKDMRIKPLSAQAQAGNVKVVRGAWNEAFFAEAEEYPDGHKDQLDTLATAMAQLSEPDLPYGWLRNDPKFRAEHLPEEMLTEEEKKLTPAEIRRRDFLIASGVDPDAVG